MGLPLLGALLWTVVLAPLPALAAGEVLLTDAAALAGNVTPGDAPGYPITLSQPGSYQLAGNLTLTAGGGIQITSSYVTIDFNGFQMDGSGTAGTAVFGNEESVVLRDGTITGFGSAVSGSQRWTIENMRMTRNGRGSSDGNVISLGEGSRVLSSIIAVNNRSGILCDSGCVVAGSIVSANNAHGVINARGRGIILGSTVTANGGYGVIGTFIRASTSGYGNNTIVENAHRLRPTSQATNILPMSPNACRPPCP